MTPSYSTAPRRDAPLRVRLTTDQRKALERIATEDGVSVSEIARRVFADFIRARPAKPRKGRR